MPIFEYRALDAQGQAVTGTLVSPSLAEAAGQLAGRGLAVEHVGLAKSAGDPLADAPPNMSAPPILNSAAPAGPPVETAYEEPGPKKDITGQRSAVMTQMVGPLVMKVPLSDLMFFFRQLATMLHAGVGMVQSLDTLVGQTRDPRLKMVVREMSQHAKEGRPMTAGMQRYPEVFSPLMVSMTRAGEESGSLESILRQVADYIEKEIQLRSLLRKLTIYPKLVLVASIFIILGANMFIAWMGKDDRIYSPLTNPVVWMFIVPLVVLLFLFFRVGLANARVKHNYDQFLLALPYLGTTLHQFSMAKFGRAFAALHRAGVPMHRAIKLAADACGSEYLRSRMYPAARDLEEGQGITETFAKTGAFSPVVLDMTRTGETTGQIDQMLDRLADFYEQDSEVRAHATANIFSVVVLVCVGIYVAYVVITFFLTYLARIQDVAI
jgi:type II secretory pathway component PulF